MRSSWWLAAALLPGACASVPPPPVDDALLAAARAEGYDPALVTRGWRLLVTTCTGCHSAVHPASLSLAAWDAALPRMLPQAHLGAADGAAIRAYVVAARRLPAP